MNLRPGQFWLLKIGPVVEITEIDEMFVNYDLNGKPAKVLRKHFLEMIKRRWVAPKKRVEKRKRWGSELF